MSDTSSTPRRFGPCWVEAERRRLGSRPAQQRQLTYDIAVLDEYAPWRDWIDEQLALLPAEDADALAGRLWLDKDFWSVLFELATGAHLREAGFEVAYERALGRFTPDWTALSSRGEPLFVVEVHTDNPPPETFAQMRDWHGLVERIKQIPVPVVLMLAPSRTGPVAPPDARTAKRIAAELRRALLSMLWPSPPEFTACGYTFHVQGDPRRGGRMMESPLGLRACFVPPTCRAGAVSAQRLLDNVREKVAKYREPADEHGLPLAVAAGSHKFTGVTLETVDLALSGSAAPVISIQFDASDPWIHAPVDVEVKPVEPWPMPPDLAALFWVEHTFPFPLTARPNPAPRRPLPPFQP
jgi:hypothetical protein